MDKRQIEVYSYYRRLYPGVIVLYHIADNYVALGDDAVAVAQTLVGTAAGVSEEFGFPVDDVGLIGRLGDVFQLKMIDYRNDDGDFDYPDIQRLKQEKYEDY